MYLPLQFVFLYDFHVLNLLEAWQAAIRRVRAPLVPGVGQVRGPLLAGGSRRTTIRTGRCPRSMRRPTACRPGSSGIRCCRARRAWPTTWRSGRPAHSSWSTGSNMSGKSTLLRAIGVNAVLAQAGAPVCAEHLSMPPVALATSMRVRDSLEAGVSFYMAELMRLKEIVDLARDAHPRNDRMLLYLLDEILLGTNSKERHIAVVRVLQHLLHRGTIGAISTHDLDLAASEHLASACRCVHFCETLHDRARGTTDDVRLQAAARHRHHQQRLEAAGNRRPGRT